MRCPGCQQEMDSLTLPATLGQTVTIDMCAGCRAFWFDPFEELHLTPDSTLRLFQLMAGAAASAAAFPAASWCPHCHARLLLTHDRQRNTRFAYWRCDHGHGRFMPFAEFLREKDFIRAPTPEQIDELRKSVKMVRCSSCGAPIDLVHDAVCTHCGAPLSIVDVKRLAELAAKDHRQPPPPKQLTPPPVLLVHDSEPPTLLDLGLQVLTEWLSDLL
jgi:Transcription factor zinc-finger